MEPAAILDVAGAVPASAAQGLLAAARSTQFSSIQQVGRALLEALSWCTPFAPCRRAVLLTNPNPPAAHQALPANHPTPPAQAVTNLIADGYPAQEILLQLQTVLLEDAATPDSGAAGGRRGRGGQGEGHGVGWG